ncbi:60S ribosomal protein L11-like [Iris pallida]|uniref:60S ribosomal protein L11-like n=1 Tax=Iris pallida TaxID=29817 RepID=A0AAX6HBB6_IRIPA|nr:60S ribosomal protein L11-like [Iris pallida]
MRVPFLTNPRTSLDDLVSVTKELSVLLPLIFVGQFGVCSFSYYVK